MAYVVNLVKAKSLIGKLVGDGQCVTFIHNVIVIPAASLWKQGERVRGNVSITPGTVITFHATGTKICEAGGKPFQAFCR